MKKVLALLLAAMMLLTLCACGKGGSAKKETGKTTAAGSYAQISVPGGSHAIGTQPTNPLPDSSQSTSAETKKETSVKTSASYPLADLPEFDYDDENQFNDVTFAW